MYRNLNGIRTMNRLPECLVVIDPRKEKNAIGEARKLGITTVALIDTDCDPDEVDLPIPGNDDSIRSIELIVQLLADAIVAGKAAAGAMKQEQAEGAVSAGVRLSGSRYWRPGMHIAPCTGICRGNADMVYQFMHRVFTGSAWEQQSISIHPKPFSVIRWRYIPWQRLPRPPSRRFANRPACP